MQPVRPKKALGQHFLTDQGVAQAIVSSLRSRGPVLEVGPGTGVLTQYLLQDPDIELKVVEIDSESVRYLLEHYPKLAPSLLEADFLKMDLHRLFPGSFALIGNLPYNISSQIFFKVFDCRDRVPEMVCMIQKEVAERLAAGPGSKTYGILSVLLQAWYDIEYLFTVGEGAFLPPPKVKSAVIRLTRSSRESLGCDEELFKKELRAGSLNWIAVEDLKEPMKVTAKIRYSHKGASATVYPEGESVRVVFDEPQRAITPGQAAVFYDGDIVVGGGTIL